MSFRRTSARWRRSATGTACWNASTTSQQRRLLSTDLRNEAYSDHHAQNVSALEAQRYWEGVLERVTKPTAKALIGMLDLTEPLGLPRPPADAPRRKPPALLAKFREFKAQHPTKALLIRVRGNKMGRKISPGAAVESVQMCVTRTTPGH